MDSTTQDDFLWLLSDEAVHILEQTQDAFCERINAVRIAKSLRAKTTATRAALVMEQAQLRIRAHKKFQHADQMFFTRRGLEQATSQDIAEYKSRRFAGFGSVADVCCGIGGDLVGLVSRTGAEKTTGVDSDELTCLFAKHNAQLAGAQYPEQRIRIRHKEFSDVDFARYDAVHCDPDRRKTERTVIGARFSPSLDEVLQHLETDRNLAIKIAPATTLPGHLPGSFEREWIGDSRECKQQMIWHGMLARKPGNRTATCVGSDQSVHQLSVSELDVDQTIEMTNKLDKYIFEPHPTILAAGLTDAISNQYGISRFTSGIAYLTGAVEIRNPLLSQFEVVDVLPLDLRQTVQYLKKREIGYVEIKKRAIENVIFEQFNRMKISGPNRATLILTRIGRQRIVAVTRRQPGDFGAIENGTP